MSASSPNVVRFWARVARDAHQRAHTAEERADCARIQEAVALGHLAEAGFPLADVERLADAEEAIIYDVMQDRYDGIG